MHFHKISSFARGRGRLSHLSFSLLLALVLPTAAAFADTIDDAPRLSEPSAAVAHTAVVVDPIVHIAKPAGEVAHLGAVMDIDALEQQRGGTDLGTVVPLGGIVTNGVVSDNRAIDVVTGSNAIREGSFANASGIPIVIQNTGANVLIQNATIVNVQLR